MTTPTKQPAPANSRKNRDQESLYKPGQLSRWFFVTSVILLISWVLMLWQDYARPWKTYQKDFYATMLSIEETRTSDVRVSKIGSEELAALEKQVADFEQKYRADGTFAELTLLRERLHDLKKDAIAADNQFKSLKGDHAVAKYQFEMARLHRVELADKYPPTTNAAGNETDVHPDLEAARELTEETRDRLNQLADQWLRKKNASASVDVEVLRVQRQISSLEQGLVEARRALAAARADVTKQETKLEGLQQKYANNQWRNAPFVDFISPTIKIEQVVLDDIHDNWNFTTSRKVDRCMTCHVGIAMPDFANPEIVDNPDFGVQAYMRAHSHVGLIMGPTSPHKIGQIGCTVCHHGVGWAVDFSRCSHTPVDPEQREQWTEDHDWYKAKYIDYPMVPLEYVQGMCHKCHQQGLFEPVAYEEDLDHGYVQDDIERGIFAQRAVTNDPADAAFDAPGNTILPPGRVTGAWQMPTAPTPFEGTSDQVAEQTRQWLDQHNEGEYPNHDDRVNSWGWSPERFTKGYDTVVNYGCQGCHKIQDFGQQVGYDEPPRVGPDLTYIADKVQPGWIPLWVKYPDAFRVDTRMPSFYYFMQKDSEWQYLRNAAGERLDPLPVMDAHLIDLNPDPDTNFGEVIGVTSTRRDRDRFDVSILAQTQYLLNQRNPATGNPFSRSDPTDPGFSELYVIEPPAGDRDRGRALVNQVGCTACHIVPEIEAPGGAFVPDVYEAGGDPSNPVSPFGMYRFNFDTLLMRGPRLTALGSKIKSREWLNAWLANPRHYTSHTRMPNMRLDEQERADVLDYLLSFRDEAFEAMEAPAFKPGYAPIVRDMYQEFFGKDQIGNIRDPHAVAGEVGDLTNQNRLATVLSMIGERLMMRNGCFGCHVVAGHQDDQPIGTELTKEGIKDLHQLDFGRVPKYAKGADGEKKDVLPHTRHGFIRTKLTYPRIYDFTKQLRWTDKLRMPRFNFRMDDYTDLYGGRPARPARADGESDVAYGERIGQWKTTVADWEAGREAHISTRGAVAGIVLGLVDEPILPGALFDPDAYQADIIAGRRVVKRYGCNNCHTLEGQRGLLWGWKVDTLGTDKGTLPPNLFTQGWRTRDEWLMKFLQTPEFLRPIVQVHMPQFGLSDDETLAVVNYMKRLAGPDRSMGAYNPGSALVGKDYDRAVQVPTADGSITVTSAIDEAGALFKTINCNKCHLPADHPLAGDDGGVAPSFDLTATRLRHQWVRVLLDDPGHLISDTKMPVVWSMRSAKRGGGRTVPAEYAGFQFGLRDDADWQAAMKSADAATRRDAETRLAELQMDMLTSYVMYHYEAPEAPSGEPPEEGK